MASLLAAAIFFVGIHFVISGSPLRGKIVASLGDGPFRGLFLLAFADRDCVAVSRLQPG